MSDQWTERLSEYVDGDLDHDEQRELENHVRACADCAAAIEELRAVARVASNLDDADPATDLWPGIAGRIRAQHSGEHAVARPAGVPSRWRLSLSVPQLLAAALAFALVGGGAALLLSTRAPMPIEVASDMPVVGSGLVPVAFNAGGPDYDGVILELQHALEAHRDQLDSSTVRAIRENLVIIDRAIEDAMAALKEDPADLFLNAHLVNSKRMKLDLLTRVVARVSASS